MNLVFRLHAYIICNQACPLAFMLYAQRSVNKVFILYCQIQLLIVRKTNLVFEFTKFLKILPTNFKTIFIVIENKNKQYIYIYIYIFIYIYIYIYIYTNLDCYPSTFHINKLYIRTIYQNALLLSSVMKT